MTTAPRLSWATPLFFCAALPFLACGTVEPPLDQLELRDALLADPAVIAALPQEAQQRLAGRFWTAMAAPDLEPQTAAADDSLPVQRLRHFDAQRQQRGQDALLSGRWEQSAATQTLTPLAQLSRSAPSAPLPPLLGRPGTVTAAQEARALAGRAGAVIEDLRRVSGAQKIERVTSWPTALVAIEDRVYVNATWLTAVAALESGESAAGSPGRAPLAPGVDAISTAGLSGAGDKAVEQAARPAQLTQPLALGPDAVDPGTPPSADSSATGGFGSCSSCSSSSCNNSSCNSSSSSSSSSCNASSCVSSEDKQCCRACAITPERAGPDLGALWLMLWLGTPLAFLAGVDLRSRSAVRRRARA